MLEAGGERWQIDRARCKQCLKTPYWRGFSGIAREDLLRSFKQRLQFTRLVHFAQSWNGND
jgi:hypothetical protein